jgi:hypothetical protein
MGGKVEAGGLGESSVLDFDAGIPRMAHLSAESHLDRAWPTLPAAVAQ